MADAALSDPANPTTLRSERSSVPARPYRLVVPTVTLILFWAIWLSLEWTENWTFWNFLIRLGLTAALGLILAPWWLAQSRLSWRLRLGAVGLAIVGAIGAFLLMHPMVVSPLMLLWCGPALATLGTIWLYLARPLSETLRAVGVCLLALGIWFPMDLIRMEGMAGDGGADVVWRWAPTTEETFLASRTTKRSNPVGAEGIASASESPPRPVEEQPGDWTGFRGPTGDSRVPGLTIATDWSEAAPSRLWRHDLGPGWSSILVVDGRLYTQELRGPTEATVCYDADTGEELWATPGGERFEEALGGSGPRATPAFADGRVYAFGARGRLDCLDAATGQIVWTHDVAEQFEAPVPIWGFSSSPLVVDQQVIVFVGGPKKILVAFDRIDGDVTWTAEAGTDSYSSPGLIHVAGNPQVAFLGETALTAFEPDTGKVLWTFANPGSTGRPTLQPQMVGPTRLVVSFTPDDIHLVDIGRPDDATFVPEKVWTARDLRPDFSDVLVHKDHIYGFNGTIFACLELATGKRTWKGGRYGTGQALLLPDQDAILVLTESGELVLVACDPSRLRELTRGPGLEGKTWNHPALAHGRLYLRNAQQIACYELPVTSGTESDAAVSTTEPLPVSETGSVNEADPVPADGAPN